MADAAEKLDPQGSPSGMTWGCSKGHHIKTTFEGDNIYIPPCRKDGCASRIDRGTLFYEVEGERVHGTVPNVSKGKEVQKTELWRNFTSILDKGRIRMAGGEMTDRFCISCEERPHGGPIGCACPCHPAWAYRKAIEDSHA